MNEAAVLKRIQKINERLDAVTHQLVLGEVADERARQDAKWGQQDHEVGIWLGILGEEFGEVAKEIAESQARPLDVEHLREELVQTAAVAVAWVEAIDRA